MRETGRKAKKMAMVSSSIQQEISIRDSSKVAKNVDLERSSWQMETIIEEILRRVNSMAQEYTYGLMGPSIRENSKTVCLMVEGYGDPDKMTAMKESTRTIKSMERESTLGATANLSLDNFTKTRISFNSLLLTVLNKKNAELLQRKGTAKMCVRGNQKTIRNDD